MATLAATNADAWNVCTAWTENRLAEIPPLHAKVAPCEAIGRNPETRAAIAAIKINLPDYPEPPGSRVNAITGSTDELAEILPPSLRSDR